MTKQELIEEMRVLWVKACNHDGVDEDEKFVCFTTDNPFLPEYDRKMKLYLQIRKEESNGR